MTAYYEWNLKLTDNQKMNLVKSIKNKCPLTLRIKYLNLLKTDDKLLVTERQMNKIDKAMDKGTGLDLKLSKEQIRKIAKHGGNLFTSLATLGAKVLPYAVKGVSKAVPALFLHLEAWELIRFFEKELIFLKNIFLCYLIL